MSLLGSRSAAWARSFARRVLYGAAATAGGGGAVGLKGTSAEATSQGDGCWVKGTNIAGVAVHLFIFGWGFH